MKYSGDIGEEIVSSFFDTNFSEILSFRNPKTKDNAQVSDIIVWLNRYVFLIEVKTLVSSKYSSNDWAKDRIIEGVGQLEKNYEKIKSKEEIFLNNKYYHVKLDCEGLSKIFGLIILVHDDECTIEPHNVYANIYNSKLPIHVFSWNQIKIITSEIDTIPDFKYYLQDRIDFARRSDIPLNKELDAIGLYKKGGNEFPNEAVNLSISNYWQEYLNSMSEERARREEHNKQSRWLDRFESIFTDTRKLFHGIPIGLHFTWVFAVLCRRERASIGIIFETVQDRFLDGHDTRIFSFKVPATGHWMIFYYSKHQPAEQHKILSKLVDQKLIQLIEDEDFQYAVFGFGIQISTLLPPEIMGLSNALLIGADTIAGKYSKQDVTDAKQIWGNIKVGTIEEFPSS
ncbi:MAG: hypothetical protein IH852_15275 [Bacteroidetes bacterium]|nr:hypothetical protein [Bacteroidota bacterium]